MNWTKSVHCTLLVLCLVSAMVIIVQTASFSVIKQQTAKITQEVVQHFCIARRVGMRPTDHTYDHSTHRLCKMVRCKHNINTCGVATMCAIFFSVCSGSHHARFPQKCDTNSSRVIFSLMLCWRPLMDQSWSTPTSSWFCGRHWAVQDIIHTCCYVLVYVPVLTVSDLDNCREGGCLTSLWACLSAIPWPARSRKAFKHIYQLAVHHWLHEMASHQRQNPLLMHVSSMRHLTVSAKLAGSHAACTCAMKLPWTYKNRVLCLSAGLFWADLATVLAEMQLLHPASRSSTELNHWSFPVIAQQMLVLNSFALEWATSTKYSSFQGVTVQRRYWSCCGLHILRHCSAGCLLGALLALDAAWTRYYIIPSLSADMLSAIET